MSRVAGSGGAKLAVVGAGAWGTALAIQAHRAGCAVTLVARDAAAARGIDAARVSPRLPGFALPAGVSVAAAVPAGTDLLVWAVPAQALRASLVPLDAPVVVCAKGVERGTNLLPLEILRDAGFQGPAGVLSGPNFAHEIAAGLPAAAVAAAADPALRDLARRLLGSPAFRLYTNDDPLGVQLGGAAKNVVAIAAGAVTGAGLGENARAALVTRGLAELARLVAAAGGRAETAAGLSGMGDLLLTCTGAASRNFGLGLALGRGQPLAQALAAGAGVIEGVATADGLLARVPGLELPVIQAVAAVLSGRLGVPAAIELLLSRPQKDE